MAKRTNGDIPEEFRVANSEAGTAGSENGGDNGSVIGAGDNGTVINPAEIGSGNTGSQPGQERKKRGRPKGGGQPAAKSETGKTLHLKNLDFVILNAHLLLSKAVSAPELEIDQGEANAMGEAVKEVMAQYDVGLSDKAAAWTNLVMVMTAVYGGRVYRISDRKTKERMERVRSKAASQSQEQSAYGANV